MNADDKKLIDKKGISEETIEQQLSRFKEGFPFLKIESVAVIGNGITRFDDAEVARNVKTWKKFQAGGGRIEKFVPASGAASRMFKNIFAFVNSGRTTPETDFEKQYFDNIDKFAFYGLLDKACQKLYGTHVR